MYIMAISKCLNIRNAWRREKKESLLPITTKFAFLGVVNKIWFYPVCLISWLLQTTHHRFGILKKRILLILPVLLFRIVLFCRCLVHLTSWYICFVNISYLIIFCGLFHFIACKVLFEFSFKIYCFILVTSLY